MCGSFYLVRREWQFSLRLLQGHPLSCAPMLSTNGQNPGSHWGSAAQAKLWVWLSRLMLSCCRGCEDGNGSKWCPLEATPAIWEPNPAAELLSPSPLRDLLKQPGAFDRGSWGCAWVLLTSPSPADHPCSPVPSQHRSRDCSSTSPHQALQHLLLWHAKAALKFCTDYYQVCWWYQTLTWSGSWTG